MADDDANRRLEEVGVLRSIYGDSCVTVDPLPGDGSLVCVRPGMGSPWFLRAHLPANYPSTGAARVEVDGVALSAAAHVGA
jgi:hypothetical protein